MKEEITAARNAGGLKPMGTRKLYLMMKTSNAQIEPRSGEEHRGSSKIGSGGHGRLPRFASQDAKSTGRPVRVMSIFAQKSSFSDWPLIRLLFMVLLLVFALNNKPAYGHELPKKIANAERLVTTLELSTPHDMGAQIYHVRLMF